MGAGARGDARTCRDSGLTFWPPPPPALEPFWTNRRPAFGRRGGSRNQRRARPPAADNPASLASRAVQSGRTESLPAWAARPAPAPTACLPWRRRPSEKPAASCPGANGRELSPPLYLAGRLSPPGTRPIRGPHTSRRRQIVEENACLEMCTRGGGSTARVMPPQGQQNKREREEQLCLAGLLGARFARWWLVARWPGGGRPRDPQFSRAAPARI